MPTKLDRVQVLFQKELFKKLKIIAKIERRSLSSMVGSIVEDAINSKKYQSLLSKAKSDDLKSKIDQSKLLINEILKSKSSNQSDIDENSKLKQIEDILSLISESNKESLEESMEESVGKDLLLVEEALKPDGLVEELELETDYKINKMNVMLSKINKNKDLNV
ncbi:hypothetical protein OA194_01875 [Prochlorococcus sp. AH-716-O13]|nr:hypothetical protein [Prochlorococcus sp. AH-716-O13]